MEIAYVFFFMMICADFLVLFTGDHESRICDIIFWIAMIIFLIGLIGIGVVFITRILL